MPIARAANRRPVILKPDLLCLIEYGRIGEYCFDTEKVRETLDDSEWNVVVIYLMVPGEDHEPALVKLYTSRTGIRWDEPGPIFSWNGNHNSPTLNGAIKTEHWCGVLFEGKIWTEYVERN